MVGIVRGDIKAIHHNRLIAHPAAENLLTAAIPYDPAEVATYQGRLIAKIRTKIAKARNGYDLRYPMILSVWCNEHRAIYLDTQDQWQVFVENNKVFFDDISPFAEIVFWDRPSNTTYSLRP